MVVLYGSNDLAFQVARDLQAHGEEICFVETDQDAAGQIAKQGSSLSIASEI